MEGGLWVSFGMWRVDKRIYMVCGWVRVGFFWIMGVGGLRRSFGIWFMENLGMYFWISVELLFVDKF